MFKALNMQFMKEKISQESSGEVRIRASVAIVC